MGVAVATLAITMASIRMEADRVIKAQFRIHNPLLSEEELEEAWEARKKKLLNP